MSWTLESGACPQCQTENSVHIETCRSCNTTLPWAGSATTNLDEVRAVHIHEKTSTPTWVRIAMMAGGALLVFTGIMVLVFTVLYGYTGRTGAGLMIMIGSALFVKGEGLEVEEQR